MAGVLPMAIDATVSWLAGSNQPAYDGFYVSTSVTSAPFVYQPYVPTILLQAADIETNPGPDNEDIMKSIDKLGNKLSTEIQGLSSNIKKLQTDFTALAIRQGLFEKDCETIKQDQKKMMNELKELKMQRKKDAENMGELLKKCDNLSESVDKLDQECDRLEGFSRRDNVRFFNIKETENENCKQKVLEALRENVGVGDKDWNDRDIIRAHRLGRSDGSNQGNSRPLIAKFAHWEDKMLILGSRDDLRKSGIRVAGDLTRRQRENLKRVNEETGKRCYYKGQKLVIPEDRVNSGSSSEDDHDISSTRNRPLKRPRANTPK